MVGDDCTLFHGVTLGGTGKVAGDRHPKLGQRVVVGAGASVLGNIKVGDDAKVGAGASLVHDLPKKATVVGYKGRVLGDKTKIAEAAKKEFPDSAKKTAVTGSRSLLQPPQHALETVLPGSSLAPPPHRFMGCLEGKPEDDWSKVLCTGCARRAQALLNEWQISHVSKL